MHPSLRFRLIVKRVFNADLLSARYYARLARRQGLARAVRSALQTRVPRAFPLPPVPHVIGIEPTTRCNLRCVMCPSPALEGPRGDMSLAVFDKVLREAAAGGARRVRFVGLGEPLLHRELPEMVRRARRAGLYTEISTNGTMLTRDLGLELLDAGLDQIGFSLDSADEAEYERIRRGASFREVVSRVEQFLALCAVDRARAPTTVARMVVMDEAGVEAFARRWAGRVDSLQFNLVRRYEGSTMTSGEAASSGGGARPAPSRARCRQIMCFSSVTWDGMVALCSGASVLVGDVKTTPLATLWRGPAMEAVRRLHARREGHRLRFCRGCPMLGAPQGPLSRASRVTAREPWSDRMVEG